MIDKIQSKKHQDSIDEYIIQKKETINCTQKQKFRKEEVFFFGVFYKKYI